MAQAHAAVRTLPLCDLVASTRLVERIGGTAAAGLLARHDRVARELLGRHGGRGRLCRGAWGSTSER